MLSLSDIYTKQANAKGNVHAIEIFTWQMFGYKYFDFVDQFTDDQANIKMTKIINIYEFLVRNPLLAY